MVLAHALVTPERAPRGWLLALHGLLGRGANLRSLAQRLVAARPEWGVALVDLRLHGGSRPAPPPHTVAAAAGDVLELAAALAAAGRPPRAVVGHSLGGKVALAVRGTAPGWLADTWVLEAAPGPRPDLLQDAAPDAAARVLTLLGGLPARYARREDFVGPLVQAGLGPATAAWLAQSLDRDPAGLVLRLDLQGLQTLLRDHAAADLWPAALAPAPGAVHFVLGGRSGTLSPAALARLEAAAIDTHVLPGAGHWVHVEAADEVAARLARGLAPP
jgi:pimeloyl-ACP methyl ester carboxylesterase